jgi:hypothetical protein
MRQISALAMLLLVSCFSIKAQKPIICSEDSLKISNGLLPGISVLIPEVNYENTLASWIKVLQSGTKSNVVTDNGEMTIFGTIIKEITKSENKISKAEKTIEKAKTSIPKNDKIQDKFKDQINEQEAVVQKFTDKLNQIKGYR